MHPTRISLLSLFLSVSLCIPAYPQQTATSSAPARHRDSQAIAVLQQSLSAMGGSVPQDSVATGTISLVAGSKSDSGTIRITTRGTDQTSEHIQTADGSSKEVFSRGNGSTSDGTANESASLEWAATAQTPAFPLILIASALTNPDSAYQYVALENMDGVQVHHLRFWNTYSSNPRLQSLSGFTVKDFWIDASSGLPKKLSCIRRAAQGASPGIAVDALYSDYRLVGGVLYPFRIVKFLNGTSWATITIQSVLLNIGLTDADFAVQ